MLSPAGHPIYRKHEILHGGRPPKTKDISSKHVILELASISLHSILKITFLLAKPDGRATRPDQLIMLQDIEF